MAQQKNEINQAVPEAPVEAAQFNAQQLAPLPAGQAQAVPLATMPVINWAVWGLLAPPTGQNAAAADAAPEEPGQGPAPAA